MTLDTFVELSVILTGHPKAELQPQNDTHKVSEEYLAVLTANTDPEVLQTLNDTFLSLPSPDHDSVNVAIMESMTLAPVAKNITKMWYLAIWYTNDPSTSYATTESFVVSSNTYTQGLAWSTMSAHPMGYSEFNFGYWETPPTGA